MTKYHIKRSQHNNDVNKIKYFTDIDECANGTGDCDTEAECTNTPGSYTCQCNQGYTGNGTNCTGMVMKFIICLLMSIYPHSFCHFIIEIEMVR